jgi:hypothetical protein
MRIPNRFKVGPCEYEIIMEDDPFISDDKTTSLEGQHDPHTQTIRLWRRHPDATYVTFWHEILHAISEMAGTDLDEDIVHRLAPILVTVLLDNGIIARSEVESQKT